MIEISEGEKQCRKCLECKPVEAFSLLRNDRRQYTRHSYCKACRNANAKAIADMGRRKDVKIRAANRDEIWPRPFGEAMLDLRARKWVYPVQPVALRWAA